MRVSYVPTVPEDPAPPSPVTQWSSGIAMFAAFVLPFVLLLTSARYRLFADQAFLKLSGKSEVIYKLPDLTCAGVYRSELIEKARRAEEVRQQTPVKSGPSN